MFSYANSFQIVGPTENRDNYILNFTWNDPVEARKILQNILNLTSDSFKKSIFEELEESLEIDKKIAIAEDRDRLIYLKEQSSIAKELDIVDNQIDNINLDQSSVSLNINTVNYAYYLRGYKAIDKEIELIKGQ